MAFSPIAFVSPNYRDFKTHWVKPYIPGGTTPKVFALESDGGTQVAKLEINADGFLISAGEALVIPYIDGAYDLWMFPSEAEADANDTSNALRIADDILGVAGTGAKITPMTLAEAVANTSAVAGQIVQITDREDAQFTYLTGQTPNTYDIVAADKATLDLVLSTGGVSIDAFGASPSSTPATNQGAIQAAIDNQSVVYGLTGVYQHSGSFTGKSNLEFTGENGFTLQCETGFPQENQITFASGVSNIKIHNIIFDMQNTVNTPVLSQETKENSLDFEGCTDVQIYNNSFINTLSRGIRVDATVGIECENMEVHHNNFTNGSKGGFELRRFGRNIKAYNNVLTDSVDSSFGGSAAEKSIGISGAIGVDIYNNTVTQTNGDAGTIIVEFIDRQSEDVNIYGNKCYGCGENSIKVGASVGVDVYANYSHDAGSRGIYIEGCKDFKVHHNFIYDTIKNSIFLAEDGDTARVNEDGQVYDNQLIRANVGNNDIGSTVAAAWVTATTVTEGEIQTNSGNIYSAQSTGTTGATAPTHGSGIVSDGNINWEFISVTGSEDQDSYHIFTRGGGKNIKILHNVFIEDSLTSIANGVRSTDENIEVSANDFSQLRDGVIALRNDTASGRVLTIDNIALATELSGVATILQPATTVLVDPATILTSNFGLLIDTRTKLNGTVAYIYKTVGPNNKFTIRARDSSNNAPTVSIDLEVDWTWNATDASGTFAKTN